MAAPVPMLLRRLLGLAGCLLGGALLLWLLFPWLVPRLAPVVAAPWLAEQGLELVQLELDRPGPDGLRVHRLVLVHGASGSRAQAFDLRLERSGAASARAAVRIGRLDVALVVPPSSASAAMPALAPVPTALPGWPPLELRVQRLTTTLRRDGALWRLDGAVTATPADAVLAGTLAPPGDTAALAVSLTVEAGGHLRTTLGPASDPEAVTLAGRLALGAGEATFTGRLAGRLGPLLDDPRLPVLELALAGALAADAAGARLRLDPESRVEAELLVGDTAGRLVAALAAPLTTAVGGDRSLVGQGSLPLRFELAAGTGTVRGTLVLEAPGGSLDRPESTLRLQAIAQDGGRSLEGRARGKLSWSRASGRLALAPGATLHAAQLAIGGTRLEGLRLELPEGLLLAPARGALEPAPLQVSVDALHGPKGRVAPFPVAGTGTLHRREGVPTLTLSLDAGDGSLEGELAVEGEPGSGRATFVLHHAGLAADGAPARIARAFLPGPWPATAGTAAARAELAVPAQRTAAGTLSLELRDAAGSLEGLRLEGGVLRAEGRLVAGTLELPRLELEAELLEQRAADGTLVLAARALVLEAPGRLHAGATGPQVTLALRGGFAGIDSAPATVEAPSLEGSLTVAEGAPVARLRLEAPVVEAGVTLTDAHCSVLAEATALTLTDCAAATLGGRVAMPRGTLAAGPGGALRGTLPVALQGLELAELLALLDDPALAGTGVLDGALPLSLDGDAVTVEDGRLAARPPGGRLRYAADPSLRARLSQPGVTLALDALRDFRYERLALDADYGRDGTLVLDVRLEGANPDLEGGRPVHFNLSVTQNLPVLLQSLRLSQNIGESFERRLRERSLEP